MWGWLGEVWDTLWHALEGCLLFSVNAGLELGDLSLQDCFQNGKMLFQSIRRLKGLCLGRLQVFHPVCKEWTSLLLCDAAVPCMQLLLPRGLA